MSALRPALPPENQRPPRTAALRRFNDAVTGLNTFYWGTRAGFHAVSQGRPAAIANLDEILPPHILAHFTGVPLATFDARIAEQLHRLHFLCTVDAVTFYEEYLGTIVYDTLLRRPLPKDKIPRLPIPLDEATANETSLSFVSRIWARQRTDEVVGENYEKRPATVDRVLAIDVTSVGSEHGLDADMLKAACLARNCIVHRGGLADQRTIDGFAAMGIQLVLDQPLPIDETRVLGFFGALWAHAQDVDLLVRTSP